MFSSIRTKLIATYLILIVAVMLAVSFLLTMSEIITMNIMPIPWLALPVLSGDLLVSKPERHPMLLISPTRPNSLPNGITCGFLSPTTGRGW